MKIIITESQLNKILSEQMGLTFWAENALWGINPDTSAINSIGCQRMKNSREVFVSLYNKFKSLAKPNDDSVKKLCTQLKNSMEGINLSTNNTMLNFFKTQDDKTIGSVIMNWKKNTGSTSSFYDWLSNEKITTWDQVMDSLSKNPNIKTKNYDIDFCAVGSSKTVNS